MTPILLFTYKRLALTRQTIEALQRNLLAGQSELFIFSDGARAEHDLLKVQSVRDYLRTVTGFKKVTIIESEKNMGLAGSIINGVSNIINAFDQVIVLEDDLVTSRNFLSFCNQALDHYRDHPQLLSVGAYTRPIDGLAGNEVYFTRRATSWGWATWKDRWNRVDWEVSDFTRFSADRGQRKKFNEMGSDMAGMLDRQMRGEMSSWAIRWCYHQFRYSLYTVFPAVSKVINIGFTEDATHTKDKFNRFRTDLDDTDNTVFDLSNDVRLDKKIIKQFVKPYSIPERVKYKLLNALPGF
jgi:hypothetical protein